MSGYFYDASMFRYALFLDCSVLYSCLIVPGTLVMPYDAVRCAAGGQVNMK